MHSAIRSPISAAWGESPCGSPIISLCDGSASYPFSVANGLLTNRRAVSSGEYCFVAPTPNSARQPRFLIVSRDSLLRSRLKTPRGRRAAATGVRRWAKSPIFRQYGRMRPRLHRLKAVCSCLGLHPGFPSRDGGRASARRGGRRHHQRRSWRGGERTGRGRTGQKDKIIRNDRLGAFRHPLTTSKIYLSIKVESLDAASVV